MLPHYKMTKPSKVSSLVAFEADPELTRATGTLLAGDGAARTIKLGTLVGKISGSGTTSAETAADAGNTGDGTLTLADPAFTATAMLGVYTINCTTGGGDGTSKFRVEDPAGNLVGTATGGAAFNKAIKFTIAGGSAAFVEGDSFTVTLSRAAGADDDKIVAWDPDATDGSEIIRGISLRETVAENGADNVDGVLYLKRMATLVASSILWPDGITDPQKSAAIADMDERLFISVR
ncbi:head decoration protein [Amorphus orientalis]|uniref:Head decoration protein n=1 Tax=Amorphus orientalis TaxID=649198 RepID=A0AAE3VLT8_9HYPH|nr:head decoration protein [Amorphus orientalis]MDQ0314844.1 hypothetical protein [Amorphus orientalis]